LLEANGSDGGQKIQLFRKMIVRRAVTDAGAARHLSERERRRAFVTGSRLKNGNNAWRCQPPMDHHFLINPYGMTFDEITASDLVKVDLDGDKVM
jgi:ribulose-5-phosphate 4-epimerase/fuculose-1-phosphate aldolase